MKKQFYINQTSHLNCSGRHHVAVCTFQNRDSGNPWQSPENHSTTSNLINVPKNDSIFLQTARSEISSLDKRNCQNFRILFDNGSQLSYISPEAAKNLSFKALGKKEIVVKIFGNVKALKKLDMLPFAVKSKDENLNTYINAFVTDICYPEEDQQIDLAKQTYSH